MSLEEPLVGIFDKDIQIDLDDFTTNITDTDVLTTNISSIKDELVLQRHSLKESALSLERAFKKYRDELKADHKGQEPFRFVFNVYFENNLPVFEWCKVVMFNKNKPAKLEPVTGNILKQKRLSNIAEWERQMYYHLCHQIEEVKERAAFISEFEKHLLNLTTPLDKLEMYVRNKV